MAQLHLIATYTFLKTRQFVKYCRYLTKIMRRFSCAVKMQNAAVIQAQKLSQIERKVFTHK